MVATTVSKVVPDFDLLVNELVAKLQQTGTWIDLLPTGVGTTNIDLFAGATVSNQLYIDIALREAFLPTAVRDSSIFSGARMLGVNIARKTPANCTVELSNFDTTTAFITPYAQFQINGRPFYTRTQYIVPPGGTISNVNLYSGTVEEKEFLLDSITDLALKEILLGVPNFAVSQADLLVYTENVSTGQTQIWNSTDKAIFEHTSEEYVYFESTNKDGDVSLFFGDGTYGKLLQQDDVLHVRYALTDGALGNSGLPGLQVRSLSNTNLKGELITSIAGGANEKSAIYYKMFAPTMARTKKRAISGSEIRATIMGYPGVADVSIQGQRDIAPNDSRWANTIRVCLLPEEADTFGGANPNPASSQWFTFVDWLQPLLHYAYTIQRWNPTKIHIPLRVKLAILPTVEAGEIRIIALEALLKLFQKKPGTLGRRLSESDITGALKKIEGIDYVVVNSPTEEIVPNDITEFVVLNGTPLIDVVYSERTLGT